MAVDHELLTYSLEVIASQAHVEILRPLGGLNYQVSATTYETPARRFVADGARIQEAIAALWDLLLAEGIVRE